MSYLALYRKYRPANFEDMVGQNEVIEVIKAQGHTVQEEYKMIIIKTKDYNELSKKAADIIGAQVILKPDCVFNEIEIWGVKPP